MTASDTTFIRDMSHYDSNLSLSGFAGTTHKITEGTGYVDPTFGARMPGFRAPNRVLGSYHVLHTGNLSAQLEFWIAQQDKLTPWWRDWPHWVMQIDAEKWPNDPVSLGAVGTTQGPLHLIRNSYASRLTARQLSGHLAMRLSTTVSFARMLADADIPGLKICYASRGQFGDNLAGIAVDLWNAAYHSSSYPGNAAADWRPYSGRTPVFWQYTSNPYDKNAFRGSVAELLAYIEGGDLTTVDLTTAAVAAVAKAVKDSLTASTAFPADDPKGGNHNPISDAVWNAAQIPGANNKRVSAWQAASAIFSLPTAGDVAAAIASTGFVQSLATQLAPLLPTGAVITPEQLEAAVLAAFKAMAATA